MGLLKGQLISKAIYGLLTSPKTQTDEFVLFPFLLFTVNKSNSSVLFLGESMAGQSAFRFFLTFNTFKKIFAPLCCSKTLNLELADLWEIVKLSETATTAKDMKIAALHNL